MLACMHACMPAQSSPESSPEVGCRPIILRGCLHVSARSCVAIAVKLPCASKHVSRALAGRCLVEALRDACGHTAHTFPVVGIRSSLSSIACAPLRVCAIVRCASGRVADAVHVASTPWASHCEWAEQASRIYCVANKVMGRLRSAATQLECLLGLLLVAVGHAQPEGRRLVGRCLSLLGIIP